LIFFAADFIVISSGTSDYLQRFVGEVTYSLK